MAIDTGTGLRSFLDAMRQHTVVPPAFDEEETGTAPMFEPPQTPEMTFAPPEAMAQTPAPPAPARPDLIQNLIPMMMGIGAAMGGAPQTGAAMVQGWQHGQDTVNAQRSQALVEQQRSQALALQTQRQEAAAQQQLEQRRMSALNTSLDNLRQQPFKTKADYDAALAAHDQLLASGYGVREGTLRRMMGNFIAPDASEKVRKALEPLIREQGFSKIAESRGVVMIDTDDDGMPEAVPIAQALQMAGWTALRDPVDGTIIQAPPDVQKPDLFAGLYASELDKLRQEGKNIADPQVKRVALERAKQAEIAFDVQKSKATTPAPEPLNYKIDPQSTAILGQTGLSQNAFLAATGQMSSLPRDQVTRNAASREWQNYAVAHGIDTATFVPRYQAIAKTLEANTLRNNQAEIAQAELDATLTNLATAADEGSFRSMRWANVAKMFAGQEFNDPAVSKYRFHLEQLRSEFAMYNAALAGQIDSNGNIREITQSDMARAEGIIRDGFAQGGLEGFLSALNASREKMQVVLDNSVDIQNKRVWDLFGVGQNYRSKTSGGAKPLTADELIKKYGNKGGGL
jgi:hypothetical protein